MEEMFAPFVHHFWPWRRVPDVVGRTVDEATTMLTVADLEPHLIDERARGVVVTQHPPAGSRQRKGTDVMLYTDG